MKHGKKSCFCQSLLGKRQSLLFRQANCLRLFLAFGSQQFRDIREEYSGAIALSTTLSELFSVLYAPKICVVIIVVPWSCPLGDYLKF